jgi:tetratricopeptide (TPR) repeat protein
LFSPVDSGAARRVRCRLEGFRVDRELVGCPTRIGPVPETLRPIFSDRHDFFASPSLEPATVAALADSAALVILASPHSVRSRYVDKQIKFFKLRHPERPVIVLIVEGRLDESERTGARSALRFAVAPDWAGPADAVPRDLYESDGFELAIAKVIARLIGLGVWDVYQRAETARHRGGRICTAAAAAMVVLATASGVLTWQSRQSRLAVADFAALAERYKLASPTQAAAPGAKESISEAITTIAQGAARDPRYAEALELLKAGKPAEAEPALKAAAEDKAMRVAQIEMQAGKPARAAAVAYRALASIAAISDPGRAREYYAKAARLDPSDIVALFRNGWFQQEAGQFDVAEAMYRGVIASVQASNSEWVLWAHFGKGDIERERGHLDDALATYREGRAIAENRAKADPANLGWQYDLGISNERIGDLLMALGDHAGALKSYRAQQEVLSRMAGGDPDRADRKVDPADSDIKTGSVPEAQDHLAQDHLAQDHLAEVLTSHQASLADIERLAKANLADAGWQHDLALSYERVGTLLAWQDRLPGALRSFSASLAIVDRLARVDPGNAGWQHDLAVSYVRIGDVLAQQHDLPDALISYRASLAIADRLAKADPANGRWQHETATTYGKVGDVLAEQDRLPDALNFYRASLAIVERLAKVDPGEALWQRELSATYSKVGDIFVEQRNLPDALKSYQTGLAFAERLAEVDPGDAGWRRELSATYNKVGDMLLEQRNVPDALRSYRAGLAIAERLAVADPSNARRQTELSEMYDTVGDLLKGQGNLPEARKSYSASLAIAERLTNTDPGNAGRQRDLAVRYGGIGDMHAALGNLPEALKSFSASLAIAERLIKADPGNAGRQRDLAGTYSKVGDVLQAQGKFPEALKFYQSGLATMSRVAKGDPGNAGWQRDLAVTYSAVGDALKVQGKLREALKSYSASLAIMARLAKADPRNAGWQRDLSVTYVRLADFYRKSGLKSDARKALVAARVIMARLVAQFPQQAKLKQEFAWFDAEAER